MASPISEEVLRDGMDRKQELLLSLRKAEPITIADLLANRRHHDVPGVYAISTPADDEIVYVGRTKIKSEMVPHWSRHRQAAWAKLTGPYPIRETKHGEPNQRGSVTGRHG